MTAMRRCWSATHVIFEPLDFIARLVALVPRPRVHLTRYRGLFAPHSAWRAQMTPTGRGSGKPAAAPQTPAERHRAMSWAQRLKRIFKLDLESCEGCGGQVRMIAGIEDPGVITKILAHLEWQPLPVRGEKVHGRVTFAESTPAADEQAGLKGAACRPADPGILGSQGLCSAYTQPATVSFPAVIR